MGTPWEGEDPSDNPTIEGSDTMDHCNGEGQVMAGRREGRK